jgi:hypothetical protein
MIDAEHLPDGMGAHGEYQWIVTQHYLADVLRLCPEIVVNKYVAVTACDSGPFRLGDAEKASNWESRNDIAYSPLIQRVSELPQAGFDEWYVFDEPAELGQLNPQDVSLFEAPIGRGHVHRLVNFGGFGLHEPKWVPVIDLFWKQFDWICPNTYIAEGTSLTIVTADKSLFEAVWLAIRELGEPQGELL